MLRIVEQQQQQQQGEMLKEMLTHIKKYLNLTHTHLHTHTLAHLSYKQLKKLLYRNSKVAATKCVRQLVAIAAELAQSDDVVPQSKGETVRRGGEVGGEGGG